MAAIPGLAEPFDFVGNKSAVTILRTISMNRQKLLDLYFLEARSKLIDLAAFFDRLDRAEGL